MPGATVLRDAIWGDVDLGPRELALIDTQAFQRLRRVKQLGLTDLVFPGAHHTRFEHSIGVFHLGRRVLERLRSVTGDVSDDDARAFLAACLLHDVGHYPFSHAIEELEVDQVRRHADIARDIISGELADVIQREWDVDPVHVAGFVTRDPDADVVLRSTLDSGLDVDKLDYLVRDARGANVPYGLVDVERLIGSFAIVHNEKGDPTLAVESRGVSALQSLVFAKHLMFASVYWHHACRAAVVMLLRSVQEGLRSGYLDANGIERSDDHQLLSRLSSGDAPSIVSDLALRLRDRRLYKRAVEVRVDEEAFARLERLWFHPMQRCVIEDGWAASLRAPPGSILLDVPEPRPIVVDLPVVVDGDRATDWDQVSGLSTDDLERFQRWVRTIRIFAATPELAERVRESLPATLV